MTYQHNLDPAIFKLGAIQPRWYALMYIVAFAVAYFMIARHPKFKGRGFTQDDAMDLLTYGFVGVLAGGRIGYILFYNLSYYLQNPLKLLAIWEGGMSFHGGLIGSILAIMLYARKKHIPMGTLFDIVALPVPLGLFFGRLGNFINGELWGKPTDQTWGVAFQELQADGTLAYGPLRHPTQLYEAALEGLLLFGVLWLATRFGKKLKAGSIGALFLMGYGLARFAVEFNRLPDGHIGYLYGDWLTMGHVLSLPMIVGGLAMLIGVNVMGKAESVGDLPAPAAPAVRNTSPLTEPATAGATQADAEVADAPDSSPSEDPPSPTV
ncbi:MAG: prolipoprotein diacylglyceryl transferase [Candidatus Sericytochromatia bacterium]